MATCHFKSISSTKRIFKKKSKKKAKSKQIQAREGKDQVKSKSKSHPLEENTTSGAKTAKPKVVLQKIKKTRAKTANRVDIAFKLYNFRGPNCILPPKSLLSHPKTQLQLQRPPPPEGTPVVIEPLRIEYPFQEDPTVEPMADTRTMAQLLQAPTEGYEDAILIPEIVANNFELKHRVNHLVQNKHSFVMYKEDRMLISLLQQDHLTMRSPMFQLLRLSLSFFHSLIEEQPEMAKNKKPPRSIQTWDDLTIAILDKETKLCPAQVLILSKAVEQIVLLVVCPYSPKQSSASCNVYRDNISEYVSQAAAANYNQVSSNFRPQMVANHIRPPGFPPVQNSPS
ncbi:hypothetical protein Tco_0728661 [Tanacetum coccineum]|uniref:Reverse transcriptase domain-containing protein n=1 Tax=Tanacetum coccineum TaxID=301880 RepID=A0ABQ4YM84_9ASTR